ncbi:MAG: hypothetical protein JSR33_11745, partial [Proteobacteria bacterium]|nr:hypothetical protein [Pseudomonadota bacterium]
RLNSRQIKSLQQGIQIYNGALRHAHGLLVSPKFTNIQKDFEALIYSLEYSPRSLIDLKSLILKFSVERLHNLGTRDIQYFLALCTKRFGKPIIQEIQTARKTETWKFYNLLVAKIPNCKTASTARQTLIHLYQFYHNGFTQLRHVDDFDTLFKGHLSLIITMDRQDQLPDFILLDFVQKIYPFLGPLEKQIFTKHFFKKPVALQPVIRAQINNMIRQQWTEQASLMQRYISAVANDAKLHYPAYPLEQCALVTLEAKSIADKLEIAMVQEMANQPSETKSEIKRSIPDSLLETKQDDDRPLPINEKLACLVADIDFTQGPAAIEKVLSTSVKVIRSSGEVKEEVTVTGRELLAHDYLTEGKATPFVEYLHEKACQEFRRTEDLNTKHAATYLKKVVMAQSQQQPMRGLLQFILNDRFWVSKSKFSSLAPQGIRAMQDQIIEKGTKVKLQDLQKIAVNCT